MKKERFQRIHLIVMDSVGIGAMPDAAKFGDAHADTFGHIGQACGGLYMPHMEKLGLGNIHAIAGIKPVDAPSAYYTKMQEASNGKDTLTGHWEMMGLFIDQPFRVFPDGFPDVLILQIEAQSGRKVIGNKSASGTEIIEEFGARQLKTGELIVYTSADSVLQIAAHEAVIPVPELYEICQFARDITRKEPYKLGRIIARPFVGVPGAFKRTANRHDYALKPFEPTVMNYLKDAGYSVFSLGKIADIYDGEGITEPIRTQSNADGMDKLCQVLEQSFTGLSFLNLVDFDAQYGHRRDALGYARALEAYDVQLGQVLSKLAADDLLIITADHGNDPTYQGTDHTREYVPLLVYSPRFAAGKKLPLRKTFADIGATIAENFAVQSPSHGSSFLADLK